MAGFAVMAPETITRPRPAPREVDAPREDRLEDLDREWGVLVFDNSVNTWDEVITVLQLATACTLEEAFNETWEIHHQGRSLVHHADEDECNRVAGVIRTIGIDVSVELL